MKEISSYTTAVAASVEQQNAATSDLGQRGPVPPPAPVRWRRR
jgi:hypothetical protein